MTDQENLPHEASTLEPAEWQGLTEQTKDLLRANEGVDVEFKGSARTIDEGAFVALCNSGGGALVIGVTQSKTQSQHGARDTVIIEGEAKSPDEVNQIVSTKMRSIIPPISNFRVREEITAQNKRVYIVTVPPRPRGIPFVCTQGGRYLRRAPGVNNPVTQSDFAQYYRQWYLYPTILAIAALVGILGFQSRRLSEMRSILERSQERLRSSALVIRTIDVAVAVDLWTELPVAQMGDTMTNPLYAVFQSTVDPKSEMPMQSSGRAVIGVPQPNTHRYQLTYSAPMNCGLLGRPVSDLTKYPRLVLESTLLRENNIAMGVFTVLAGECRLRVNGVDLGTKILPRARIAQDKHLGIDILELTKDAERRLLEAAGN